MELPAFPSQPGPFRMIRRPALVAFLLLTGCLDIFMGGRTGTDACSSASTWVEYRRADFVRFPTDSDSILRIGFPEDSVFSDSGWPFPVVATFRLDASTHMSWDSVPSGGFRGYHLRPLHRSIRIVLADPQSANPQLCFPGTGIASIGMLDSLGRSSHHVWIGTDNWSLALRWPDGRKASITGVPLVDDIQIDLGPLAKAPIGCRSHWSGGRIEADSSGVAICR